MSDNNINTREEQKNYDISIHIFSVSATMVGVCLTVIGILGVASNIKRFNTYADDLLSINALFYLMSCFLSYISIRTRKNNNKYFFERVADTFFLAALTMTTFICVFIVIKFSPGFFVNDSFTSFLS